MVLPFTPKLGSIMPLELYRTRAKLPSPLVLQHKLLTPNDFKSLKDFEQHLMEFQRYYEQITKPFECKFTRQDLTAMLNKLKLASLVSERIAA